MKLFRKLSQSVALLLLILSANLTWSAGLLTPVNSGLPELKIKQHHVDVTLDGSFITTSIEQVFTNSHDQQLEAIYSFPVPEHAVVGEFVYWIDGQPVVGEVVEKQRAREIYEQEKSAGREAALVEKDKYRTFDIHVTPVLPRSDVKIKLVYIQSAYLDSSVGRYVYPLEEGGVDEASLAFWSRNTVVEEDFSFNMHLRSAYPIEALRLPKHSQAITQKISDSEWRVSINNNSVTQKAVSDMPSEASSINSDLNPKNIETNLGASHGEGEQAFNLDQDILVYWRLAPNLPAGVDLVTYKDPDSKQGTFMLTLTPGDDLAKIQQGRDWVFVLDVSGSMQGKYASLVEGVRQAITKLPEHDRFKVIVFNYHAHDLTAGFQSVDEKSIRRAIQAVATYQPDGGTNLYAGLEAGLKGLDADRPNGIVLVTDGVANVGNTERKTFLKLLQSHDIRLFTFIMGNSANRPLLEEMTNISNGFALSVSNSDDIVGKVIQATEKLHFHAMRDVEIKLGGVRTANVIPGQVQSLYRGEQMIVMGHYFDGGALDIEMIATVAGEEKKYRSTVLLPKDSIDYPEIERLWGYAHIQQLTRKANYFGEDADTTQALIDTALEYGLVTDYTSMIVVREDIFEAYNMARKNNERVDRENEARLHRDIKAVSQQKQSSENTGAENAGFTGNRPSLGGGGGGSTGLMFIVTLLLLSLAKLGTRQKAGKCCV